MCQISSTDHERNYAPGGGQGCKVIAGSDKGVKTGKKPVKREKDS